MIRLLGGTVLAALGVAGAVLPILPGWLFFAASALVLFPRARLTLAMVEQVERRFPRAVPFMNLFR